MHLTYGFFVDARDPEPWGKAFSYSFASHGALLLFLLISLHSKPAVQTVLTEVNFIEAEPVVTAPAPKEEQEEKPAEKKSIFKALIRSKSKPAQGKLMKGSGGRDASDRAAVKGGIDISGAKGTVQTNPELRNKVAVSNAQGRPDGQIVTSEPMTGPIVSVDQFGIVGKKRGSLVQLAGDTGGTKKGLVSIPEGAGYRKGPQIALATMDVGELRKKETSLGVPLVSQGVVTGSLGGRIRELATSGVGQKRKASAENLKANPFDKDKWGKTKGPFSMEGPLKYRKILKMDLPPYPRWAEEKAIETSVSFRLWVNAKGRVKDNMYLEKTSGYSELDHLAKEALMKFIFVPLPSNLPQDDEWGVATFRFELTK